MERPRVTPLDGLSHDGAPGVSVKAGQLVGGKYEVRSIIAHGGMGVVCEATHVELGVAVALKFIHPDLAEHPHVVQRFLIEARTAAGLRSEHIARVYDAGRLESGEPFLVMERLEGVGVDALLQERGRLGVTEAIHIVLQACAGLAEAHAVGLVHRDIKPANLFVTRRPDGQPLVKVLDFGIAKRLDNPHVDGLTDPRSSIGSPWYMSPEQMRDPSSVNQRTDIWALGIVLFELLTGTRPFDGATVTEVCAKVLMEPAPPLRDRLPSADTRLERIIARCLEPKAEDRYATVTSLAEDLGAFGSARSDSTTLAPTEGSVAPRQMRHRGGASLVLAGAVAIAIGAGIGVLSESWEGRPSVSEFVSAARPLAARYAWLRSEDTSLHGEDALTVWSAPPFIAMGATSERYVATDAAGRSCAPAERERDSMPATESSLRREPDRNYVFDETQIDLNAPSRNELDTAPPL
jgi:serine/threonine protein kinase